MEAQNVIISENYIGKIIGEDIYANTQTPIIKKNTVISAELLHVLKVFQISKIPILKDYEERVNQINTSKYEVVTIEVKDYSFEARYQEAVNLYKKEFLKWQSLVKIDIVTIRSIILPLVDEILNDRTILFNLNDYSNPNEYLYHHNVATGLISAILAQNLGFNKGDILQIAIAGVLADAGLSKIPTSIREKKGALSQQEFIEIRKHPIYSYQMVKELPALKENMKLAILEHHERLDGSGYPRGLKIDNLTLHSQVIAVADTFHAMTSERIYRPKESPFKVVEMIKEHEFGKFSIKVVQALMNIVVDLPISMKVELSNFEQGEVMFINKYSPTRPIIKLIKSGEIVDLSKDRSLYIVRIITN